jgi:hypothetical protein
MEILKMLKKCLWSMLVILCLLLAGCPGGDDYNETGEIVPPVYEGPEPSRSRAMRPSQQQREEGDCAHFDYYRLPNLTQLRILRDQAKVYPSALTVETSGRSQ